MTTDAPALPPATHPAACSAWLPREELTRLAVLAYDMARRESYPPEDQPFYCDSDGFWSDRKTFLTYLVDNLELLLSEYALSVGAEALDLYDAERLEILRSDWRRRVEVMEAVA